MRPAAAVQPGDGDADGVIGPQHFAGRFRPGERHGGGGGKRGLQEDRRVSDIRFPLQGRWCAASRDFLVRPGVTSYCAADRPSAERKTESFAPALQTVKRISIARRPRWIIRWKLRPRLATLRGSVCSHASAKQANQLCRDGDVPSCCASVCSCRYRLLPASWWLSRSYGQTRQRRSSSRRKYVRCSFDRCLKCHGDTKPKGGLRLTLRPVILKGGDTGPAVVSGEPDKSLLIQAVA